MAVLLFDFPVVIRAEQLDRLYPGGLAAFSLTHADDRFCCDGELAAVGFAASREAWALVRSLQQDGLVPFRDGEAGDLICTGPHGAVVLCRWLEFGRFEGGLSALRGMAACRLVGGASEELALPREFQECAGVPALALHGARGSRGRADGDAREPAAAVRLAAAGGRVPPVAGRRPRAEPSDWSGIAGGPIDPRELDACLAYARMVNSGDHSLIARFLHEHAVFRSSLTGVELHGADTVLAYLHAKLHQLMLVGVPTRAEIAFRPSGCGAMRPCVLLEQATGASARHSWAGTVLAELEEGLVARILIARGPRPAELVCSRVRPC